MSWFPHVSRVQLGQILALLIVLGYVDINVITFRAGQFSFVVRGPLFDRLSSGTARYLRNPGNAPRNSVTAKAYVKLEALLAFLLFTKQAYVMNPTVVGAGIVYSIQSDWFLLSTLQRMLEERRNHPLERIVLAVLNLGVGWGLMQNSFGITGTAIGPFPYTLGFSTTSKLLERSNAAPTLPGLATLPNGGPVYKLFNQLIGFLLVIQQLHIYSVSIGKAGRVVLGITGNLLALKSIPKLLNQRVKT
ncbi:hypothetical protein [Alicyclobacillus dauci]|uniref:Rhomboid family protein n=1 Tax=Alicyclobacillus dauci TaxID=1475485 RepID=A0ABY6Z4H2_9BACL|nr:hypothetical protein [Alicyclobacillus dauci]WAH37782.1 hypothetical protein NZD86_04565 [Alicyclobacillus dauci]